VRICVECAGDAGGDLRRLDLACSVRFQAPTAVFATNAAVDDSDSDDEEIVNVIAPTPIVVAPTPPSVAIVVAPTPPVVAPTPPADDIDEMEREFNNLMRDIASEFTPGPDRDEATRKIKRLIAIAKKTDGRKTRVKKVKVVAPRKQRAEFAAPMTPIISNDGLFYIRSLSSFKFAMKDMENHNEYRQTIRFKKHGCDNTWIEFCPGFCYHENPIMKQYIDESGSMKKMGSWANSTNKLPGWKCSNKWGWREDIDFFEYRDDMRPDTKMRQAWCW
jgi:hypothetical protein